MHRDVSSFFQVEETVQQSIHSHVVLQFTNYGLDGF